MDTSPRARSTWRPGRSRPAARRGPRPARGGGRPGSFRARRSACARRARRGRPTVRMPSRSRRANVTGPTPQSRVTGSGWRNSSSWPGTTSTTPRPGITRSGVARGLAATDASLARNLFGATPTEHPRSSSSPTSAADPGRDQRALAEQARRARHVEERLVERERLDERCVALEDLVHLRADLAVQRVVAGQEHGVRAAPAGDRRRQRRVHAELPRLVRRRRHDAARTGAADHDRLAAQLRPAAELDGHEERIHVDVEDDPSRHRASLNHCDAGVGGGRACPAARVGPRAGTPR